MGRPVGSRNRPSVEETPAKRRPGRPPKVVEETPAKRRPGRPPKVVEETPAKRRPGRPPKVVEETPAKRRPGRPPKSVQVEAPAKRRPGRPPKVVEETPAKRRPGRPPKVVEETPAKRRPGRPAGKSSKAPRARNVKHGNLAVEVRAAGIEKLANAVLTNIDETGITVEYRKPGSSKRLVQVFQPSRLVAIRGNVGEEADVWVNSVIGVTSVAGITIVGKTNGLLEVRDQFDDTWFIPGNSDSLIIGNGGDAPKPVGKAGSVSVDPDDAIAYEDEGEEEEVSDDDFEDEGEDEEVSDDDFEDEGEEEEFEDEGEEEEFEDEGEEEEFEDEGEEEEFDDEGEEEEFDSGGDDWE